MTPHTTNHKQGNTWHSMSYLYYCYCAVVSTSCTGVHFTGVYTTSKYVPQYNLYSSSTSVQEYSISRYVRMYCTMYYERIWISCSEAYHTIGRQGACVLSYVKSVLDYSRGTQDSDLKYMSRSEVAKNSKSKIMYIHHIRLISNQLNLKVGIQSPIFLSFLILLMMSVTLVCGP